MTATATVVNASTINALAGGIYAEADFAADGGTATVMVKNDGAITSGRAGIDAEAYTDTSNISGSLSVGVVNTGAITSSTGTGIYTEAEGTAQAGITVTNYRRPSSHTMQRSTPTPTFMARLSAVPPPRISRSPTAGR